MKEAVVTVVVPAQDEEPAHTEVWRVAFEGEFVPSEKAFGTNKMYNTMEFCNVVAVERLTAQ